MPKTSVMSERRTLSADILLLSCGLKFIPGPEVVAKHYCKVVISPITVLLASANTTPSTWLVLEVPACCAFVIVLRMLKGFLLPPMYIEHWEQVLVSHLPAEDVNAMKNQTMAISRTSFATSSYISTLSWFIIINRGYLGNTKCIVLIVLDGTRRTLEGNMPTSVTMDGA